MSRRFTFSMRLFETPSVDLPSQAPDRASQQDLHEVGGKSDRRYLARSTLAVKGS